MSTIKTYSAIPIGYDSQLITIEADSRRGLPLFNIVGMPSKSINESRERIRSAINNSQLDFPAQKIVVNLAPSDLEKSGIWLDLPISIAILGVSKQILPQNIQSSMFAGGLALNGEIKPVRGIINIIECAKSHGYERIFIPSQNAKEAALVAQKINVFPVKNLQELWLCLKNLHKINPLRNVVKNTATPTNSIIFDQINGQMKAKRALTIALAGKHNLLISGPPGIGKSMLARSAASLLPPPTRAESIAIAKITGVVENTETDLNRRPFRTPHHNATNSAILGGGKNCSPGEISLAHTGILFLDEFPEFKQDVIDGLREPLESHTININRADQNVSYPADFILIAAMNPCPCGYYGSRQKQCTCSIQSISRYRHKISGPIQDRIDIKLQLDNTDTSVLFKNTTSSNHQHNTAKNKILQAIERQNERFAKLPTKSNGRLSSFQISTLLRMSNTATSLLNMRSKQDCLSARSYFKTIAIAQTIADLDQKDIIGDEQIFEALSYQCPILD